MELTKAKQIKGTVKVPGDKSISHRAVMFGAVSQGTTYIHDFLEGADCLSTIDCFRQMGIEIQREHGNVTVKGKGLHGLTAPAKTLDVGNSGTTMRLISGILSGQSFPCTLTGDASIQKRPMGRIMTPLQEMGGNIISLPGNGCAPLSINPGQLHGIHYMSPVASAQVKSCVLLAGMYADGPTTVTEPALSRNHTELMLSGFGAVMDVSGTSATIQPEPTLLGQELTVPGDISSAAYFIAAGLLIPNSCVCIKNVGINPTRDGILRVCQSMGAKIALENNRIVSGEPVADLIVESSDLTGTVIEGDLIPTLIDEIPMIAVLAACAKGQTIIRDAQELKVKESNRLDIMVTQLSAMGVDITGTDDGMIINGGKPLMGCTIDSHMDHRIAMSFAIAGLVAEGTTCIENDQCVVISYPDFYTDLNKLLS